jgi:magnesium transporter
MKKFEFLNNLHNEDFKNPSHPSVFFCHDLYDVLIVRLPQNIENNLIYKNFGFLITDQSYYLYNLDNDDFEDLKSFQNFYKIIDKSIDNLLQMLNSYSDKIEFIEEKIYSDQSIEKEFNKKWFSYKSDLIRINRVLNRTLDIINSFAISYKKEDDYLQHNFEDIQEHLQRASRNSSHMLEKLDSIHNFYQTQNNEQMNKIIYFLTILSTIFLPLNLMVGFFGMNTTSLPFTIEKGGTYNVVLLLIISGFIATLATMYIKKKGKS